MMDQMTAKRVPPPFMMSQMTRCAQVIQMQTDMQKNNERKDKQGGTTETETELNLNSTSSQVYHRLLRLFLLHLLCRLLHLRPFRLRLLMVHVRVRATSVTFVMLVLIPILIVVK